MNKFCTRWIEDWCEENGWTDLFMEQRNYWAFPPHAVMPMPIPSDALQLIKAERGLSPTERLWYGTACLTTMVAVGLTYAWECPMPLAIAFIVCAFIFAQDDDA